MLLLCVDSCAFKNVEQRQPRDEKLYESPVITFTKEIKMPHGADTRPVRDVVNVVWGLELIVTPHESFVVDHPERYTLELNEDDGLFFRADCNRGFGTYKADGPILHLTASGMTKAFCPTDPIEPLFLKGIGSGASFRADEDYLILELLDTSETLKFTKMGRVFESRTRGIRFVIPAAWRHGWYEIREEYSLAPDTLQSKAQYSLTLSYLPVSTNRSGQVLTRILIFQKSDWKDILDEPGPPPGQTLRESDELVYVASPPQSNPFPPDSVDGIRYEAMYRSLNELFKSFTTVQPPR
jgi:heat shock protein HslJ